jgi:hypothetical protein
MLQCDSQGTKSESNAAHSNKELSVKKQTALVNSNNKQIEGNDKYTECKGRYFNYEYGYEVLIPKGFVAYSPKPPSPQHGVDIDLSGKRKARIWVVGNYNAAEYSTLDEVIDENLERLNKQQKNIEVIARTKTSLDTLAAVRLTVRYKPSNSDDVMIEDLVSAIRASGEDMGVIYDLGLVTLETCYAEDKNIYEKILKSWKQKPLPK